MNKSLGNPNWVRFSQKLASEVYLISFACTSAYTSAKWSSFGEYIEEDIV